MIKRDEVVLVADSMRRFGGSFVESLGNLLFQADEINQQKIKDTWPDYWEKYKKFGESRMGESNED